MTASAGVQLTVRPQEAQLVTRRDSFRVLIQGAAAGVQVREVMADGDSVVVHERTAIPLLDLAQETRIVMDARSLAPRTVRQTGRFGSQEADARIDIRDGRVTGHAYTPQPGGAIRRTEIDTLFPDGTLEANQLPFIVPFLPLVEGTEFVVWVFNAVDASRHPYVLRVEADTADRAVTDIGDVHRVLLLGGAEPTRLFVTRDVPHRVVRMEGVGQPIVFELVR